MNVLCWSQKCVAAALYFYNRAITRYVYIFSYLLILETSTKRYVTSAFPNHKKYFSNHLWAMCMYPLSPQRYFKYLNILAVNANIMHNPFVIVLASALENHLLLLSERFHHIHTYITYMWLLWRFSTHSSTKPLFDSKGATSL